MARPPKPDLYERAQKAAQSQYQAEIDSGIALFQRGYYDAKGEKKGKLLLTLLSGVFKLAAALFVLYLLAIVAANC